MSVSSGVCYLAPTQPGFVLLPVSILVVDAAAQQAGQLPIVMTEDNPFAGAFPPSATVWQLPAGSKVDWDTLALSSPGIVTLFDVSTNTIELLINSTGDGTQVYQPADTAFENPIPVTPRTGVEALPANKLIRATTRMGSTGTLTIDSFVPASSTALACSNANAVGPRGEPVAPPAAPRRVTIQVSWARFYNAYAVIPPGKNTLPPQTGGPTPL